MGKVTRMPHAALSNITRVANRLAFHKPAIRDAARFVLSYDGDIEDAIAECAQRWGEFGLLEVETLHFIVEEVMHDRVTQAEK